MGKALRGIEHGPDEFDCTCNKDGRRIAISGHAKSHMITHGILPTTLCDMIADRIPCGTKRGKPHRPDARRVCSMRKERKYNIILDPIRIGDEVCWIVSNIEPIS